LCPIDGSDKEFQVKTEGVIERRFPEFFGEGNEFLTIPVVLIPSNSRPLATSFLFTPDGPMTIASFSSEVYFAIL
jgi:hypothetical protein